jgi:transcriptional regulator with XRE-family HTH domain
MAETIHIGRKISKLRELKGIKQETLAAELGISQQAVSKIEQSADVEEEALDKIAKVLGLTPDAIRAFSEDAVFNIIANTFTDNSQNNNNYLCTINPLEKIVELYERLLASEREKVELLKNQGK